MAKVRFFVMSEIKNYQKLNDTKTDIRAIKVTQSINSNDAVISRILSFLFLQG